MRQFRLVFGGSTAASAAVLAIFMGGLGFGGILLGRLAERATDPLRLYGRLELGVAFGAALSPGLIEIIDRLYLALGGSTTLGLAGATIFRLVLSALVLGFPALLMGGTLPAAVRSIEVESDLGRRRAAILYGTNTLGAVAGVLLSTFWALERYGNRMTLWLACGVNVAVALLALLLARRASAPRSDAASASALVEPAAAPAVKSRAEGRFVLIAAGLVGFAFLLMELVWYRMLTPLLGGTLFSFGLILAAALLGIGLGGFVYSWSSHEREPSLEFFAWTCALEALFVVVPYALGDRIAVLAVLLRGLSAMGFSGYLIGWSAVAMLVVFPAALVSGIQFPTLIALLGSGSRNVAVDVGQIYAWNTVGAIAGSIGGGFGLLPLMLATGAWRLVTVLLCGVSIVALIYATGRRLALAKLLPAALAAGLALFCLAADGPTAAWRHSPIGAGRADQIGVPRNQLIDWLHYQRRILKWEEDGVESSVALTSDMGYAFVVNGKIDGHSRFDAGTQVMSGLLGALLHPDPKAALIVGLGTGSTAGWMGTVPSMERVDVVELEPATIKVAEACAPVNRDVLKNPKVHLRIGDGREVLLTTRQTYDIIASEPSNPYRAGIASLYTTAFYRAVARKLRPGGLFLQWMQAYEIDSQTLRTVYATYHQTFPYVETWETQWGDLLLIGSFQPIAYDANRLRARIAQEPFRSALVDVWRVVDLEGVLAHYIAGTKTADLLAAGSAVNTDDKLRIEFAFARTLGTQGRLDLNDVKTVAKARQDDLPSISSGGIDLTAVERRRLAMIVAVGGLPFAHPYLTPELIARGDASIGYMKGNYKQVVGAWTSQTTGPQDPVENLTFGEAEAEAGSETAMPFIDNLRLASPIEADVLLARLRWKQGKIDEATALLERAFTAYRTDPWPLKVVMDRAIDMAAAMAAQDSTGNAARRLDRVLAEPFSVTLLDQKRLEARALLAEVMEPGPRCGPATLAALHSFEPNVPWRREFLARRADCYAQAQDPRAARAAADLQQYVRAEPVSLRDVVAR